MRLSYNLIYHRARSATGMFRHFSYNISAFLFHLVDDVRQASFPCKTSLKSQQNTVREKCNSFAALLEEGKALSSLLLLPQH